MAVKILELFPIEEDRKKLYIIVYASIFIRPR